MILIVSCHRTYFAIFIKKNIGAGVLIISAAGKFLITQQTSPRVIPCTEYLHLPNPWELKVDHQNIGYDDDVNDDGYNKYFCEEYRH